MVAELKPQQAALPLLLEPDVPPKGGNHASSGWRSNGRHMVRHPSDDDHGAMTQHVVVRYFVHGIGRAQIAQELGYCERQVQGWTTGRKCPYYTRPVRRALTELGLDLSRRAGGSSRVDLGTVRLREIASACLKLLDDVQWYMDEDWPRQREIKALARLLAAGREPLG